MPKPSVLEPPAVRGVAGGAGAPARSLPQPLGRPGPSSRPRSWRTPSHVPSHLSLLRGARGIAAAPGAPTFDAVIVPARRNATHLKAAAIAASRAGSAIVVVASGRCRPAHARAILSQHAGHQQRIVIDGRHIELPVALRADEVARQAAQGRNTARKRNVGLLLARTMGWQRVLFLDDDVLAPSLHQIQHASANLSGEVRVAGWSFTDFPDNSIACHAYRLSGERRYGRQTSFIGGGGLAVALDDDTGHFPEVYNEDWLFLVKELARGAVIRLGTLHQDPYDPFARPQRAAEQEFGDVLGEALFGLLHELTAPSVTLPPAHVLPALLHRLDRAFWAAALRRRRQFLCNTLVDLERGPAFYSAAVASVRTALREAKRIDARVLAQWSLAWSADQTAWQDHWSSMPAAGVACGADEALRGLGLSGWHDIGEQSDAAVVGPRSSPDDQSAGHPALRGAAVGA